ncbi:MAG TPA: TraB/GumN family protein [Sphingomicrobium sp.]
MMIALLAAAISAAPFAQAAPQPAAEHASPAMFVVRDNDTTIYIFGTFHALDGRGEWFKDKVRDAFENSGELVLETVIPEGPIKVKPVFGARALPVTPSASFLATTRMAIDAGKSQGMQVGNGADMVLRHVAEAQGKAVEGLETLELQLNMFTRMPAAETAAAPKPGQPVEVGDPMQNLSKAMAEMQTAWKHGDQSVFVRMLGQLEHSAPDTYRVMFTERNARWADWIAGRMQTPGVVFVAVGAGHLAGKDSVLVRLAEQGIESTRLN